MIFVLDSSNRERVTEAQNELVKLVQEKELKEASLLIFANKQVQSDRWTYTHSPTHRKVCAGVVKED